MRAAAADALDSTPEEILFEDGRYKVSMRNRSISFDDLVRGNTGPILAEFNGSC
jgi:hypothetical protein